MECSNSKSLGMFAPIFLVLVQIMFRNLMCKQALGQSQEIHAFAINQSIQSIFNLNSHKHFYSVEKKNRIHLNIIYNLHIEDDK